MKFLCIACDEAMRLQSTAGPDEGSLTVTFACPACGHRVAMLTNPWETQLVRTLGVKVGGRTTEPAPFEQVRASLARQRDSAFVRGAGREARRPGARAAPRDRAVPSPR
jgi:DNA-directed RNA polymerase subunit RPC12/RpoP